MIAQIAHEIFIFFQSVLHFFGIDNHIFICQFRFFSPSEPFTFTNTVFYPTNLDHGQITENEDSIPYEYLNCTYYYQGKRYQSIYTKQLIWNTISFRNIVKPKLFQSPIPLIVKAELLNEDKTQSKDITELVKEYMGPFNDYYYNSKTITQPSMLAIIRANQFNPNIWYHMKIEDSFFNEHLISNHTPECTESLYKILTKD